MSDSGSLLERWKNKVSQEQETEAQITAPPVVEDRPPRLAPSSPAPVPSVRHEYKAYGLEPAKRRGPSRLRIHWGRDAQGNEKITLHSSVHLAEVVTTSHQFLSLVYTGYIIQLSGRNLTKLVDLLQDDRVRFLQVFEPSRHITPSFGEVVIIEIKQRRPGETEGRAKKQGKSAEG